MKKLFFTFLLFISFLHSDIDSTTIAFKQDSFDTGLNFYKKKEYKKAFNEFDKCKEDKDCAAMIALLYQKGEGVEQNLHLAKLWFESSARKGELSSMHNLALIFLKEKKYKYALYWFIKADKGNYTLSTYNLGLMILNGWGVKSNLKVALKYMKKAQSLGYDKAKPVIEYIEKKL